MTKIFKIPFATQGDRTAVPDDVQADGSLSYTQGYGYDYERDQATDPAAKDIEREKMNSIFHDITGAVGEIQAFGMPVWAEEGKPYAIRSVVYHNKKAWQSKIENNNTEPTAGVAWTELKADVTAEDVGAYTKVEANLKFQPVGNYADKNEVNGKLAKDQNGADIQDKAAFISNLGLPELLDKKFDKTGGKITGQTDIEAPGGRTQTLKALTGTSVYQELYLQDIFAAWWGITAGNKLSLENRITGNTLTIGTDGFKIDGKNIATTDQLLGVGQTYKDVTASRKNGASYTNNSTKPIIVYVETNRTASTESDPYSIGGEVNGIRVAYRWTTVNETMSISFIVPPGATYMFKGGWGQPHSWEPVVKVVELS
ncbi:hypothetical protein [Morganella morganii]|uniref:hypothetical protein n=1 Tax=Morganella morganii TaxID=582 RepID=UPI002024C337|nr:hypothetical protein [Morganella morganii]